MWLGFNARGVGGTEWPITVVAAWVAEVTVVAEGERSGVGCFGLT